MDSLLAVMASAVVWHLGLVLLQRSRCREPAGPPLVRFLSFAELDLLQTLRDELKHLFGLSREPRHEQKLREVDRRLEELGGKSAERANV